MLKSTLNAAKPSEPKRPTLPHLFKNKHTEKVVLFSQENEGAVVLTVSKWDKGMYSKCWVSCWDTEFWTPLKPGESVTITVEED